MQDIGVAGQVRSGLWCERALGVEVLFIGRHAFSLFDCVLEPAGRALFYQIGIRGG